MSELLPNLEEQKHAFITERICNVYKQFNSPYEFLIKTAQLESYVDHVAELGIISTFISSDPRLEHGEPNEDMIAVDAFLQGELLGLVVASCYLNDDEFESMPLVLESIRLNIGQEISNLDEETQNRTIKTMILFTANEGSDFADYYSDLTKDYFNSSEVPEDHLDDFCYGFEFVMAIIGLVKQAALQHNNEMLEIAAQLIDEYDFNDIDPKKVQLN